jgi:acyl-CoA synthetase (AMP-forming)/AMP-acid ligase II
MFGLMQDWPLLCHRIIEHAARVHGRQEVVTRSVEGPIHRTNYRDIHARASKVSQALDRDGVRFGDRIATIAWNTWRHLESWYGIMGIGAIERFRLSNLSRAEHVALAGLMGRPARFSSSMQVDVQMVDAALSRAGIATSLREALESMDGRIIHAETARAELKADGRTRSPSRPIRIFRASFKRPPGWAC